MVSFLALNSICLLFSSNAFLFFALAAAVLSRRYLEFFVLLLIFDLVILPETVPMVHEILKGNAPPLSENIAALVFVNVLTYFLAIFILSGVLYAVAIPIRRKLFKRL